jgi:cytoskeletal protein CcmA (bactofilin family)
MFGLSKFVAERRRVDRRLSTTAIWDAPMEPPADPALLVGALHEREHEQAQEQPQEADQEQERPSVIGEAVCFVGDFTSKGAIRIDGDAKGTVQAESVTVSGTGSLDGRVSCRKLHVKGNFSGSVICDDLIISEAAHVKATLTYKTLLVQRGAHVDGEVLIVEQA